MSAFAQITVPIATEERTTSSSTATAVGEHDDRITVRGSPQYPNLLADALMHRKDLVLDFTSLKACLHPLAEHTAQETEQDFNYEDFIYEWLEMGEKNPSLESLVVRNAQLSVVGPKFDKSAAFCHGVMQLGTLEELDLGGNVIPEALQPYLKFWNVHNLKKLVMDSTGLTSLPPSIGRLQKLEILSLSKNKLSDLPPTIAFCKNLRVLNLQGNSFRYVPGVVLHLKKLEELRRLDNPLTARWNGFEGAPHIVSLPPQKSNEKQTHNPDSLQTMCTKTILSTQIDYWKGDVVGPLQCKTLDSLASQFIICENCHVALPKAGCKSKHAINVMLLRFLDLRNVPFQLHACSTQCSTETVERYRKIQSELQLRLDHEYEETIKQAQNLVDSNKVDISPENLNVRPYRASHYSGRARRRKKCVIM